MAKKTITIILAVIVILFVINMLLGKYFFKTDQDIEAEIIDFKENQFDFSSTKPFYFKVDDKLYFSSEGKINYNLQPIWEKGMEEAYISPNSKYALVYNDNELTLIDNTGNKIFNIDNCTDLIAVESDRKTGRFSSSEIQWSKNSDFFLVSQDRVWDKNYSKKNKSSIYKYTIKENLFKPILDLDEEMEGGFALSQDGKYLYYEFATNKGDLAFKKVDLISKKIVSEHFQDASLRLTNINSDSLYINYNKFKEQFQGNSFDLKSIITTARTNYGVGLYLKNKDTTAILLKGKSGYGAFKGNSFDFFRSGFFLPGNRYFIANISAKNFSEQVVIDTKTFQVMKLSKKTDFYFNINSGDCGDFVFRYDIEPNVKFATSVSLEIEGEENNAPKNIAKCSDTISTKYKVPDTITAANFLANAPYVVDGDGTKIARFPNGKKALQKFITKNKINIKTKYHGYVRVNFAVDTTGRLLAFVVTSPIKDCEECNVEAMRLAKSMPFWIPAYELDDNGNKMKSFVSQQSIDIRF